MDCWRPLGLHPPHCAEKGCLCSRGMGRLWKTLSPERNSAASLDSQVLSGTHSRVSANSLAHSHLLRFKTVSSVLSSWTITCWRLLVVTHHILAGSYQASLSLLFSRLKHHNPDNLCSHVPFSRLLIIWLASYSFLKTWKQKGAPLYIAPSFCWWFWCIQ